MNEDESILCMARKDAEIREKIEKGIIREETENETNWTPEKIVEWHKNTFPKATLESQLLKLEEEVSEVIKAQENGEKELSYDEMADVMIVSVVLANRFNSVLGRYFLTLDSDYPTPFLEYRIQRKMEINSKRIWTFKNGVYRHEEK